jgi:hypothetical protein
LLGTRTLVSAHLLVNVILVSLFFFSETVRRALLPAAVRPSEERVLWRETLVTGPVTVKPAMRRRDGHFAFAPRALHMRGRADGGVTKAERGRDPRRNHDAPPDV